MDGLNKKKKDRIPRGLREQVWFEKVWESI